jgi:hypothetical protein
MYISSTNNKNENKTKKIPAEAAARDAHARCHPAIHG